MGRDAQNDKLDFAEFSGQWFVADEAGISRLKRDVRIRAKEFLWLRKGEDFGVVIQMLLEAWNSGDEAIEKVWNAYSSNPDFNLSGLTLNSLQNLQILEWIGLYTVISKELELIVKHASAMTDILVKVKNWVTGIDIKILCNPKEPNIRAGLGWRSLGCEIRHYLDEKTSGSHRYYLSEREFALFIRQPDDSFFGFHSTQQETLKALKKAFEDEWKKNGPSDKAG